MLEHVLADHNVKCLGLEWVCLEVAEDLPLNPIVLVERSSRKVDPRDMRIAEVDTRVAEVKVAPAAGIEDSLLRDRHQDWTLVHASARV